MGPECCRKKVRPTVLGLRKEEEGVAEFCPQAQRVEAGHPRDGKESLRQDRGTEPLCLAWGRRGPEQACFTSLCASMCCVT